MAGPSSRMDDDFESVRNTCDIVDFLINRRHFDQLNYDDKLESALHLRVVLAGQLCKILFN